MEIGRTACPRADLTAGPEALGSRQFRANLRRYGRKLAAEGITFRWVPPALATAELPERYELLHTAVRLHRLRRAALGLPTTFDGARAPLHLRVIERAADTGRGEGPAFLVAERAGEVVGVLYGFQWRDTFAYYQIGWDQTWAPLRLGTAVIAEAIRAAAGQGLSTFDFLRGTSRTSTASTRWTGRTSPGWCRTVCRGHCSGSSTVPRPPVGSLRRRRSGHRRRRPRPSPPCTDEDSEPAPQCRPFSQPAKASSAGAGSRRPTPIRNRSAGVGVSDERKTEAGSSRTPASSTSPVQNASTPSAPR